MFSKVIGQCDCIYQRLTNEVINNPKKSNKGNQDSSGIQQNVINGQRSDMEKRHTQQRTSNNKNNTYKVTKVNE